jgi:uncharacterized protein (TIGR03437 family)
MLDRCRGRILATWILLFLSPAAAISQFSIEDSRLLLDGGAFVVRGVAYSNVPIGDAWSDSIDTSECLYARDFPLIAGLGANTVRTLALVPAPSRAFSQALAANDLYWLAGFPLDRFFDPRRSLSDDGGQGSELRTEILDEFRAYVEAWKDEPRLLAFVFGNEVDVEYERKFSGQPADFFSLLREAAALVEESSPGTLITTSVANVQHIGAFNLGTNDANQPRLSFWSLHVSGASVLDGVFQEARSRTAKPFLVSAFGVDAYDPATQSEASQAQAERAHDLAREIKLAAGNRSFRLLGGVWGAMLDEWWRGGPDAERHGAAAVATAGGGALFHPAWAGLFGVERGALQGFDNLRPRDAYFALAQSWGGTPPADLAAEGPPQIGAGGLTNTASGFEVLAPGSLFTIRGENFAAARQAAAGGDLPFQLEAVSVCVEQRPAPLYFASADEIRAQLPWETALGRPQAIVYRSGVASQPATAEVVANAPGIFEGAVFRPGLPCPVDGANGVRAGDYLEIYGTGLGPVAAAMATGSVAGAPIEVLTSPQASLDERDVDVVYSGLLAGAAGVYQTNVRIPFDMASGVAQLRLRQNALASNAVAVDIVGEGGTPRLLLGAIEPNAMLVQAGGPPRTALLRIGGRGGFCELVRFVVQGLPAGVRASIPVGVPGQTVPLEIWAEPGAPRAEDAPVTLTALSNVADAPRQTLRVTVLPALGDIRLRVISGGWLSGAPTASFEVDGRVVFQSSGGGPGRGFNFLVVDSQSGVMSPVRGFDTWGSAQAVEAMEVFLRSLPHGQVVLAAIADDGALLLTEETRRVLREALGSQAIDALVYQSSWAIISRVGASRPIAEGLLPDETVVLDRTLTFPMP